MKREERERMVDRLLDGALAAQNVEPRQGLEERILANLRTQPRPRPWWRWAWVPALAAAAILLAIGLHVARGPQRPASPQVTQQQPLKNVRRDAEAQRGTEKAQIAVASRSGSRPRVPKLTAQSASRQVTTSASLPRQDVFPSPTPLTPEEQALLALVRGNRSEAVTVAESQQFEREKVQKYFETGEAPVAQPAQQPAQPMR